MRSAPEASAAAIISSASATVVDIGFSTSTCLPARSNAIACGACSALGVATTAASTAGSATSDSQPVVTSGIPYRPARAAALSSRQLATATSSAFG
jgi:hypothetical protein